MRKVIISPYSRVLMNGKMNPKNYPYWKEVVVSLQKEDCSITQIGVTGEETIGANDLVLNQKLSKISEMALAHDAWASIDNFFPHLMNLVHKPGVVIYGLSDPRIFGYPYNINLLKSTNYLRGDQFNIWEMAEYNKEAFVSAENVVRAILSILEK